MRDPSPHAYRNGKHVMSLKIVLRATVAVFLPLGLALAAAALAQV